VFGREVPPADPRAAMRAGLALVPEDRRQQGLVLELSVIRNATLAVLSRLRRGPFASPARERATTAEWSAKLKLKARRLSDAVATLSGGNQQKVVLAKWLATAPKVLLIDEPTRGIDVGAKAELHQLLETLARQGLAVLMVSSELPEVLGMADRILVMREGRIVGELLAAAASQEAVMAFATGHGAMLQRAHEPA
jgi:rhamnose transport system ATP-binding protein